MSGSARGNTLAPIKRSVREYRPLTILKRIDASLVLRKQGVSVSDEPSI